MKNYINKTLILNRLKEYKNLSSDTELADFLNIHRSTLSNWHSRNSIDYDLLFSICEKENIDLNWLINGGVNEKVLHNVVAEPVPTSRKTKDRILEMQTVPLYNLEATMGLIPLIDGYHVDEEKIISYITIPSISGCDGAIYATGDSMYPLLKSGDMIAFKKIDVDRNHIFFGEMYLLAIKIDESETMKTIKFVQQSDLGDDYIKLVSHNQHHAPKDININQIAAMALVRASVRIHN